MQKKLYVGGLPWEIDRIGLINYFKAVLECNDINASYEPAFITSPLSNPNSAIRVVDVFVATDRQTGKSRGFGFVTIELPEDEASTALFDKIVELMNKRVMLGIRGPRELIVNEAEPKAEDGGDRGNRGDADNSDSSDGETLSW
ncbi:MAG: hypothetical protein JNK26_03665 [Candidatus Doudnabacteria bacterium]|nr:hypothetical protein [Candidatus Doudnabacteria bacterium]